jgi:hypothetical protein
MRREGVRHGLPQAARRFFRCGRLARGLHCHPTQEVAAMIPTTFATPDVMAPGFLGTMVDLGALPVIALAAVLLALAVLIAGLVEERRDASARRRMSEPLGARTTGTLSTIRTAA